MNNINNLIYKIYYPCLILSTILYLIPGKYKIAVYGLNYLGWITVSFVLITLVIFLFLLAIDIKNKSFKILYKRLIIFILVIIGCVVVSYYDHQRNKNLTREELIEVIGD